MPSKYIPPSRQRGLSLVELMISITVGMILLLGITTLIVQQNSARSELDKTGRQIENGRYAMQLLQNDIQLAGYYGEYAPPAAGITYSATDPCLTAETLLGWNARVPVPVFGYAGGVADPTISSDTPAGCLEHYRQNTAVLVIRRAATEEVDPALPVAGTAYLQASRCNAEVPSFLFGTSPSTNFNLHDKNCNTPLSKLAKLHAYIVRIYFVSDCDKLAGNDCADTIPTLKMVEFMNGGIVTRPMVEGIENMQFDYGVDTDGDGSPDSYCTNPDIPSTCTATPPATPVPPNTNWSDVMAVRVNLLARNNDPSPGHIDNKSYQLGSVPISAPGDNYKRHAYSELVRVINPSGRRERP